MEDVSLTELMDDVRAMIAEADVENAAHVTTTPDEPVGRLLAFQPGTPGRINLERVRGGRVSVLEQLHVRSHEGPTPMLLASGETTLAASVRHGRTHAKAHAHLSRFCERNFRWELAFELLHYRYAAMTECRSDDLEQILIGLDERRPGRATFPSTHVRPSEFLEHAFDRLLAPLPCSETTFFEALAVYPALDDALMTFGASVWSEPTPHGETPSPYYWIPASAVEAHLEEHDPFALATALRDAGADVPDVVIFDPAAAAIFRQLNSPNSGD